MKLRTVILPFIIFGLFGYFVDVAYRVRDKETQSIDPKVYVAQVKKDFSPVTHLDYSTLNK